MTIKDKLYNDYCYELSQYEENIMLLRCQFHTWCVEYQNDPNAEWIDILVGSKVVGFLIVMSKPSNDVPYGCDYFIAQTYIQPAYRRRGIMQTAVTEFVKWHKGRYGLRVLIRNEGAKRFWRKVIDDMGCLLFIEPDYGLASIGEEEWSFIYG